MTHLRTILLAASILLSAAPALALDDAGKAIVCPKTGELSETIIEARQRGVKLSAMMEATTASQAGPGGNAHMAKIGRMMVMEAYALPSFDTEQYRAKQKREFRIYVEHSCYASDE